MATTAELAELRSEVTDLDDRMANGFAHVDQRFADMAQLIEARARDTVRWTVGTTIALMAVLVAAMSVIP